MKRTIVVTVNYNNYNETIEATKSLLSENYAYHKIIIVDNCSQNESIQAINEEFHSFQHVVLLKSEKNGGYAYGVNLGVRYALEHFEFDYFLVINSDIESSVNLNRIFIEYYEANALMPLGLLCGKIHYYENPKKIWFAGGHFRKRKCKGSHCGGGEIDEGQYDEIREVTFATGCLWFFRKDLIDRIGFLSEDYFMFYEDLEFSLRVRKNGYKIIYLPSARILHKVSASIDYNKQEHKINSYNTRLFNMEKITIANKYLSFPSRMIFLFWLLNRDIKLFLRGLFKSGKLVNTFKGVAKGMKYKA